jgi:hypothetical protein
VQGGPSDEIFDAQTVEFGGFELDLRAVGPIGEVDHRLARLSEQLYGLSICLSRRSECIEEAQDDVGFVNRSFDVTGDTLTHGVFVFWIEATGVDDGDLATL